MWFFPDARYYESKWLFTVESGFPHSSYILSENYYDVRKLPLAEMGKFITLNCSGIAVLELKNHDYRWGLKSDKESDDYHIKYRESYKQLLRYWKLSWYLPEDKMLFDMTFSEFVCEYKFPLPEHNDSDIYFYKS